MINLIAESAWHHQGDPVFLKELVHKIVDETETNFVKIHISIDLDEYMSSNHPLYEKQKAWLIKCKDWEDVIKTVKKSKKNLMILFNDRKAIRFGLKFDPEMVEIHSVCLNDIKLLGELKKYINQKMKIVLGVGGSTIDELRNAIDFIGIKNIVLMHGFQNYPTNFADVNIKKINKVKSIFKNFEHGYADHCAWNEPNNLLVTLIVASQGMQYLEKHVTTSIGQERVDWESAISIEMFNELKKAIMILDQAMGDGSLEFNVAEKKYSELGLMKKIGLASRKIRKGGVISLDDFNFIRTNKRTDLSQINLIEKIGSKVTKDVYKGEPLKSSHF